MNSLIKLAESLEARREKEASVAAGKAIFGGAKWLAGFGGGGALNNAIGSGVGMGLLGAYSSEEGLENRAKGFLGGFGGGMLMSGISAGAGKAFKGLNKSYTSQAKNLNLDSKVMAKTIDNQMDKVKRMQKGTFNPIKQTGKSVGEDLTENTLDGLQKSLKENKKLYNNMLKEQGVGLMQRTNMSAMRNIGAPLGLAVGMGGGMYASGALEGEVRKTQRPMLSAQNNVFNPVNTYR